MRPDPRDRVHGLRRTLPVTALPVLSSLTLVSVTFSLGYLWSEEIWWYLASGREILATGAIPTLDPFVYSLPEPAAWPTHSWLWTVVLSAIHDSLGLGALPLLSALLGATFVVLLFTRARLDRLGLVAGLLTGLVLLVGLGRLALRAELPGWILFVAYLSRFEGRRPLARRAVLVVCGAQWLWSNLHGGYVLGILAALAYAVGDFVEARFWPNAAKRESGGGAPTTRVPLWLPPLLLVVSLLTPHLALDRIATLGTIAGQVLAGSSSDQSLKVGEWQSLLSPALVRHRILFGILLATGLLGFRARPGSRRPSRLLLFGGMAALALVAVRFLTGFAIASAFVTMRNLEEARTAGGGWPGWTQKPLARWLHLSLAVLFCTVTTAASAALWQSRSRFEVGQSGDHAFSVSPRYTCPGAADYIRSNHLPGPIFNEMPLGGYLIHRLYPEHSVFIDGRLLDLPQLLRATRALYLDDEWRALDARYGFKLVVLGNLIRPSLPLRRRLMSDPAWQLAYVDPQALVFVRGRDPVPHVRALSGLARPDRKTPFRIETGSVAERWETAIDELLLEDAPRFLLANYLTALGDLGMPRAVDAMATDFLASTPDASRVRALRARARLRLRRPQEAADDLRAVLERRPDDITARLNYAQALHRMGRTDLALLQLDRVRAADPSTPGLRTVEREIAEARHPR